MKVLKIYPGSVNMRHIAEAVEALRQGHAVIYPTDTMYGIAVNALDKKAVATLCRIKGLDPDRNLMSIVCADLSQASRYARIDNAAYNILKEYLPGPFTFVLPSSTHLPKVFKGRKTIGLRIPDNEVAQELAAGLDAPLLTGSVDFDEDMPEMATEPDSLALVYADNVAVVLDYGQGGTVPSTIVDITDPDEPQILRQGKGEL